MAIFVFAACFFKESWVEIEINLNTSSAVMEVLMTIFCASDLACAMLGGLIVVHDPWRLWTGRPAVDELAGVRESEELTHSPSPKA